MRKAAVRDGDPTTTGGYVIGTSTRINDKGKKVALIDDHATCGNCKGTYRIFGTGKGISDKGRNVVVDGDAVLCPCGKNRVIVGSNPGYFLNSDRGSAVASNATLSPMRSTTHDEQFTLWDSNGRPLSNVHYRIDTDDGETFTGMTDATGKTQRVITSRCSRLKLYLKDN